MFTEAKDLSFWESDVHRGIAMRLKATLKLPQFKFRQWKYEWTVISFSTRIFIKTKCHVFLVVVQDVAVNLAFRLWCLYPVLEGVWGCCIFQYCSCTYSVKPNLLFSGGARWLSGRVSDSGARGPGFETYRRRVVSLSKTLYSPKVLVNYPGSDGSVPTWLRNCWLGR